MRCITLKIRAKNTYQIAYWEKKLKEGFVIFSRVDNYKEQDDFCVEYSIMLGDPVDTDTISKLEYILRESSDVLPSLVPRKELIDS